MRDIRIGAAQFEPADGIKEYNLAQIKRLAKDAATLGAEVVSFHEMCITGYSFLQDATKEQLLSLAEFVPAGPSCVQLHEIAFEVGVPILAGLLEIEKETGALYNTYVCAHPTDGIIARHRKLHAFLNPHLSSGNEFTVFELLGCKCGILICYDNNIAENVRCTALAGCEVLFAPHVTGCAPGPKTESGISDPRRSAADVALWANRREDPVPLRMQLHGPSGRGWVMRWLPARAYDNNLFVVFTNPIGMDDGVLRHGNSLVIDPFGEVVAECVELGDAVIVALCASEKRSVASGGRYLRARRPELYGLLTAANPTAETVQDIGPGWQRRAPSDAPYSAAAVAAAEAEAAMVAAQAEDEPVPTVEALPRAMPKPARTPRGSTERPPRRLSVDNLMAELPGAIDGESMYSQPASLYDTAANEDEEDERAEAAEMAASFGALNLGGGSSGWTADSYSVPDGFAEYAQHAQQAPTDLELPVPSVGPSLVTESIYNRISEGVPEVSADATSGSGWADDAYAVPEGYDEYVQSLTASTGTLARAQEEAGLLPTNFAPAPAPAPALASIDAVTAEESSLLPAFGPAPMPALVQPTDDLLAASAAGMATPLMGASAISADLFADDQGDAEGDGSNPAAEDEAVAEDQAAVETVTDVSEDA